MSNHFFPYFQHFITYLNAHKMNFSIKRFFSKYEQIPSFVRILTHLLKKLLIKSCIICAVPHKYNICCLTPSVPLSFFFNFFKVILGSISFTQWKLQVKFVLRSQDIKKTKMEENLYFSSRESKVNILFCKKRYPWCP